MRQQSQVDVEKTRDALHAENQDMAFVPNDDTGYNVTFKTWIVVWARLSTSNARFEPDC